MRSQNDALPARSSVTTFSALSSSRLPTMTDCSRSSADGSALRLRRAARRGADRRRSSSCAACRASCRRRAASAWRPSCAGRRDAARARTVSAAWLWLCSFAGTDRGGRGGVLRHAQKDPGGRCKFGTAPRPIAPGASHARADAPRGRPGRDDCSRAAAARRRECGARTPASGASAATAPGCRRPSARRSARAETAATAGAACRSCSACRTPPRSRWR